MQPSEKFEEYLKAVCDQIRWKKAHPVISEEIENHLTDQRNAYIAEGADETAATEKAIAEMGDPVTVGAQLDRTHRPKPQWGMLALTAVFLLIGFLTRVIIKNNTEQWLVPSLVSAVAGFALMLIAYFMDFTLIGKYPKTICFSIFTLSVVALLISPVINGSSFYTRFIPLLFPLGFAAIVYLAKNKGYPGIILCGIAFLIPSCIILLIPSASGFLLFAVSGLVILCTAISKGWFGVKKLGGYLLVLIPVFILLLLAAVYIFQSYRLERLQVMFNPSIDPHGAGYIGYQIRSLLNVSRLFGQGNMSGAIHWIGNDTDYLLSYMIFKFGWITFIIIMGLLLFFIMKGFMLCFKQKSGLALFLSVSIMMTFSMQATSYVIENLGLQLMSPISLPLISYGNIATIINLTLIGIMLSVFRTGDIVTDRNSGKVRKSIISFNNGKLVISIYKK